MRRSLLIPIIALSLILAYFVGNKVAYSAYRNANGHELVNPGPSSTGMIGYDSRGCPVVTIVNENGTVGEPTPVLNKAMLRTGRIGNWYLLQNWGVFKDGGEISGTLWTWTGPGERKLPEGIVNQCDLNGKHYLVVEAAPILPLW